MRIVQLFLKNSICNACKKIYIYSTSKLIKPFIPLFYSIKWWLASAKKDYSGIRNSNCISLIVSLTSFPARIGVVHYAIRSLLVQSVKPDKLLLWLATEQFPNGEKDLPRQLLELVKYGLEIRWCEDIGPYKKLIPTLRQYSSAIIITADDDVYYGRNMVKRLLQSYKQYPNCVNCHRVTKVYMEGNQFRTKAGGIDTYVFPSFLNKLTGCGGVCYSPGTFYEDIDKAELFMKLAPTNDDQWFWAMSTLNGYKTNVVRHKNIRLFSVPGTQLGESLSYNNDSHENLFWIQFNQILEYYPTFHQQLVNAWSELCGQRKENR